MKRKQLLFGKGVSRGDHSRWAQAAEHQIKNTGRALNLYVPRPYAKKGDKLPVAKR